MFNLKQAKAREEAEARAVDVACVKIGPGDLQDERVRKLLKKIGGRKLGSEGVIAADPKDKDVQELMGILHEKVKERLERRKHENPDDPAIKVMTLPGRSVEIIREISTMLDGLRDHETKEPRKEPSKWAVSLSEDMHSLFDAIENGLEMIRKKYTEIGE